MVLLFPGTIFHEQLIFSRTILAHSRAANRFISFSTSRKNMYRPQPPSRSPVLTEPPYPRTLYRVAHVINSGSDYLASRAGSIFKWSTDLRVRVLCVPQHYFQSLCPLRIHTTHSAHTNTHTNGAHIQIPTNNPRVSFRIARAASSCIYAPRCFVPRASICLFFPSRTRRRFHSPNNNLPHYNN